MADKRPSAPIYWYGGKGHLAHKIVPHIPHTKVYVDAYGGAANVLLAKEPSPLEVYNDIHGDLVNLFRHLQSPTKFAQLKPRLERTLHSRSEYVRAVEILRSPNSPKMARAWAFFVAMNQGFGGTTPTPGRWARSKGQRLTYGMGHNTGFWWTKVAWLDWWHERLARVQIESRDALSLCEEMDGKETCFYLDPPYLHETRVKGNLTAYQHEVDKEHHKKMLRFSASCDAKIVISGYAHPLYQKLETKGFERVEMQTHARGAGKADSGKKARIECLWIKT